MARIAAAAIVLDRGTGKPPQAIALEQWTEPAIDAHQYTEAELKEIEEKLHEELYPSKAKNEMELKSGNGAAGA